MIKLNSEQVISNNKIQGTIVITTSTSTIYYLMMVVNNYVDLNKILILITTHPNMIVTKLIIVTPSL